jgi:hypothetical protein
MNNARTLVEMGEFYAAELLNEKKDTFPPKGTFKRPGKKLEPAKTDSNAFMQKDSGPENPGAKTLMPVSHEDDSIAAKGENGQQSVLNGDKFDSSRNAEYTAQEIKNTKKSKKIAKESINNFMNKSIFDRLYEEVMGGDVAPSHSEVEAADAEALELPGGEEGEVTVTLDRETAKKLHDVLMAVLSEGESEVEDEVEGSEDEGSEDEEDSEGVSFEATELKEVPDSAGKNLTGKNNTVKDSWSTHHVDGKIGEGEIDFDGKVAGGKIRLYSAADGIPDSADTIPVPTKPVPVDSKVTRNVGKVLFSTGKDNYKAPKGQMRDFRKL